MLTFLKEGKRLDFNAYRTSHFNSSHIGVLCFAKAEPLERLISVLMPVRTGPPNVAKLAARSIIMQCKDQSAIHTMQVIVGMIDAQMEVLMPSWPQPKTRPESSKGYCGRGPPLQPCNRRSELGDQTEIYAS
ncbi:hypothetical protein MHU86_22176 [Fragilaria crotonensis]|nr:hypothetical protein MHU86_22176 [Fragilaria crotonensis]